SNVEVDVADEDGDVLEIRFVRIHIAHAATLSFLRSRSRSMPLMHATSVWFTGVGTFRRAPHRTTEPLMKSISVTEPFSRLWSIDVLKSAGRPSDALAQASRGSRVDSSMPFALATAIASSTAATAQPSISFT